VVLEFLGLGDAHTHECPTGKRAQMVMIVRKCEGCAGYVEGLLFGGFRGKMKLRV